MMDFFVVEKSFKWDTSHYVEKSLFSEATLLVIGKITNVSGSLNIIIRFYKINSYDLWNRSEKFSSHIGLL